MAYMFHHRDQVIDRVAIIDNDKGPHPVRRAASIVMARTLPNVVDTDGADHVLTARRRLLRAVAACWAARMTAGISPALPRQFGRTVQDLCLRRTGIVLVIIAPDWHRKPALVTHMGVIDPDRLATASRANGPKTSARINHAGGSARRHGRRRMSNAPPFNIGGAARPRPDRLDGPCNPGSASATTPCDRRRHGCASDAATANHVTAQRTLGRNSVEQRRSFTNLYDRRKIAIPGALAMAVTGMVIHLAPRNPDLAEETIG
ncbi:hypothetical protein [Paracoccus sp. Ld10]|uniref:hypothetical protein n=1 Tax=Paracoccus sp. Ld10 TaxID=649158 RepID=UPI00386C3FEE